MQAGLGTRSLQPEGAHIGHTHHAQPSYSGAQSDGRGDEPKLPCLRETWAEPQAMMVASFHTHPPTPAPLLPAQ